LYFKNIFKKFKVFLFEINIFLVILDHFNMLMLKIILKNFKKYYFIIFMSEKHFKK